MALPLCFSVSAGEGICKAAHILCLTAAHSRELSFEVQPVYSSCCLQEQLVLYARMQVRLFLGVALSDLSFEAADHETFRSTTSSASNAAARMRAKHTEELQQWTAELLAVVTKELDQSGLSSISLLRQASRLFLQML